MKKCLAVSSEMLTVTCKATTSSILFVRLKDVLKIIIAYGCGCDPIRSVLKFPSTVYTGNH